MRSAPKKKNGTRAFVAAAVVCAALSPAALGAVDAVDGAHRPPPVVREFAPGEVSARANEGDEAWERSPSAAPHQRRGVGRPAAR